MTTPEFAHLHVHTEYSLLDGQSRIERLVEEVERLGMQHIAITDHGSMYGAPELYQTAMAVGVHPVLGLEGYVVEDVARRGMPGEEPGDLPGDEALTQTSVEVDPKTGKKKKKRGSWADYNHLLLFAQTQEGYQNLLKLTTFAHTKGFFYRPRFDFATLAAHSRGLIATTGCLAGEIPEFLQQGKVEQADQAMRRMLDIFGRDHLYVEVQEHLEDDSPQRAVNAHLIALAKRYDTPLLLTNDLHYVTAHDEQAHDTLLCIQQGKKWYEQNRLKFGGDQYYLKSPAEMALLLPDYPEAMTNTLALAERCQVTLPLGLHKLKRVMPEFAPPAGYASAEAYLYALCEQGLRDRYGEIADGIRDRFEREFAIIASKGFVSYFLIVWDYVNYARRQGMRCVARGSVAGSVIAYALGMSNIDPLAHHLMFERFLNPERSAMPDIDMDFPDDRRDEVIRYVAEKYGWDHIAQIATMNRMGAKLAIRDVARTLDARGQGDVLAGIVDEVGATSIADAVARSDQLRHLYTHDHTTTQILDLAQRLEGTTRAIGTHAAGIVIAGRPLVDLTPVEYADRKHPETSWLRTQYDQATLEAMGLLKMDFLGVSNLTILQRAVQHARASSGEHIDLDRLPLDDAATFALLARGETTGVFQLESPPMRAYLRELQPTRLEDIISMVALYRPGPMDSIPTYITAKRYPERVKYADPRLEPILASTYGVIVYQDQVLQIAVQLAGFRWGEADAFRKAMGKKLPAVMMQYREKFIAGCVSNGVKERVASDLWELVSPFAGYGFGRAHAAAYALVAYQTAYMKAHYPAALYAASLSTEAGDALKVARLVAECRAAGVAILPPDVNASGRDFTVEVDDEGVGRVRFSLAAVRGVGEKVVDSILAARDAGGPFTDAIDLVARAGRVNVGHLVNLAKAGAFDSLDPDRATLIAHADLWTELGRARRNGKNAPKKWLNTTVTPAEPLTMEQQLSYEQEVLGVFLSGHPLDAYRDLLARHATTQIGDLNERDDDREVTLAGRLYAVEQLTSKRGNAYVRAVVQDLTGDLDVVAFSATLDRSTEGTWTDNALVTLHGRLEWGAGKRSLLCTSARLLAQAEERRQRDEAFSVAQETCLELVCAPTTPIPQVVAWQETLATLRGNAPYTLSRGALRLSSSEQTGVLVDTDAVRAWVATLDGALTCGSA